MAIVLMCIKVFFSRVFDVSLGTIRTVFTIKGKTIIASIIAFIEVTIWFLIAKEALNTATNTFIVISYAGGYSVGTLLGTYISKNFIKGLIRVEVITDKCNEGYINKIKSYGYGISIVDLKTFDNSTKNLLLIEVNNKELKKLTNLIRTIDSSAFIVINDSKLVFNGFIK